VDRCAHLSRGTRARTCREALLARGCGVWRTDLARDVPAGRKVAHGVTVGREAHVESGYQRSRQPHWGVDETLRATGGCALAPGEARLPRVAYGVGRARSRLAATVGGGARSTRLHRVCDAVDSRVSRAALRGDSCVTACPPIAHRWGIADADQLAAREWADGRAKRHRKEDRPQRRSHLCHHTRSYDCGVAEGAGPALKAGCMGRHCKPERRSPYGETRPSRRAPVAPSQGPHARDCPWRAARRSWAARRSRRRW